VKVVVIADKTGAFATSLGTAAAAFQTRADVLKAAGGTDFQVDVIDSQTDPNVAATVFRDAIGRKPDVIVYSGLSSSIAGVADLIASSNVPVLAISAPDALAYPPKDNVFIFGPTATQNAIGLVNMAERLSGGELKGKRVGLITFKSAYSDEIIKLVKSASAKKGFELVANESIELGAPSAASQAAAIADAHPDVVMMGISGGDAPTVFNNLNEAGIKVPVVAYTAASAPALFERFKAPNYFAAREAQLPRDIADIMSASKKAGVADQAQSNFYTDGWMIADAIAEAASRCKAACDGPALVKIFGSLGEFQPDGNLLFGPLAINSDSHTANTFLQYFVWDNSKNREVPSGDPIAIDD
jgi:ABC-type branched-subunit amino acid transport system substrate-binding protein